MAKFNVDLRQELLCSSAMELLGLSVNSGKRQGGCNHWEILYGCKGNGIEYNKFIRKWMTFSTTPTSRIPSNTNTPSRKPIASLILNQSTLVSR